MAYEDYGMDPMGNVTGYVDQEAEALALREEEERKRKEEQDFQRKQNEKLAKERDNLAVHKQEVTTYANGSKTITNVAEVPATANAPGRPNVKPVAPDDIYQNQLRAESGNRQNNRNGQIMTSPKGALGIAQIMPSTAMQPGYGVPDIFTMAEQRGIPVADRSEATARQLLANKDLNQAFGQNYSNAMRDRFGDQAGVAAYNAGPGAVERNMGRNQGQFNVAQAPQETQDYLGKVMRGVGNVVEAVIPSAQAGTVAQPPANVGSSGFEAYDRNRPGNAAFEGGQPTYDRNRPGNAAFEGAPVAPSFQGQTDEFGGMEEPRQAPTAPISPEAPVSPYSLAPGAGAPGIRVPGMRPTGVASSAGAIDAYQTSQNNPLDLMKLGHSDDPAVPEWLKDRARNRAADLVTFDRNMSAVQEQAKNMSETDLAKRMREKTTGGSYFKLFMYNLLGMDKSAAEESAKLGKGDEKLATTADGKPALIKYGINGTPIEGYDTTTGKKLTAEQLAGSSIRAKLTGKEGKDESLATARTQASHAFTSTKGRLEKQRDEFVASGATPADLQARGLDDATIQQKSQASSDSVMSDAQRFIANKVKDYGLAATGPAPSPSQGGQAMAAPVQANVVQTSAAQPTGAKEDDPYKDSETLRGWDSFRPGESVSNKKRRTAVSANDIQRQAELLVTGDMEPKDITGLNAGNLRANAVARAKEMDPTYSPVDAHLRVAALKQWTKPDSPISKQISAHITAANSIDDVRDYFKALNNGNVKLANEVANRYNDLTGKPEFIQAKTGMMLLGPEIIKSIVAGGGGVTERKAAEDLVNPNLSPKQWAAAFKTLEDFQGNGLKSQENRWTAAKLSKEQFRERMLGGSPAAQELLDRVTKHQSDIAARKAGLPSAPSQSDVEAEMRKRGLIK